MQLLSMQYSLKVNKEISQHLRVGLLLLLKASTGDTRMTLNEKVSLDVFFLEPFGKYYLLAEMNLEPYQTSVMELRCKSSFYVNFYVSFYV